MGSSVKFVFNDGGRKAAGFEGTTGDCVVRAIAIATETPYQRVYDALFSANKEFADTRRGHVAKSIRKKGATPRNGNFRDVYEPYLNSLGWKFVSCMSIGSGCKVHLKKSELPSGRIIARVSKHLTAVVDGVQHDLFDNSREGTRCVYGYYIKDAASTSVCSPCKYKVTASV